jgi:hypothetical protein
MLRLSLARFSSVAAAGKAGAAASDELAWLSISEPAQLRALSSARPALHAARPSWRPTRASVARPRIETLA